MKASVLSENKLTMIIHCRLHSCFCYFSLNWTRRIHENTKSNFSNSSGFLNSFCNNVFHTRVENFFFHLFEKRPVLTCAGFFHSADSFNTFCTLRFFVLKVQGSKIKGYGYKKVLTFCNPKLLNSVRRLSGSKSISFT